MAPISERIMCPDSSTAIEEALRQRSLGNKVSVGREPFEEQWYVRVIKAQPARGASREGRI